MKDIPAINENCQPVLSKSISFTLGFSTSSSMDAFVRLTATLILCFWAIHILLLGSFIQNAPPVASKQLAGGGTSDEQLFQQQELTSEQQHALRSLF